MSVERGGIAESAAALYGCEDAPAHEQRGGSADWCFRRVDTMKNQISASVQAAYFMINRQLIALMLQSRGFTQCTETHFLSCTEPRFVFFN